jgi:DNA-binding beta-propeller fold protein YncE
MAHPRPGGARVTSVTHVAGGTRTIQAAGESQVASVIRATNATNATNATGVIERERFGRRCLAVVGFAVLVALESCSGASAPSSTSDLLVGVVDIALPGSTSRFDYQSFDPTTTTLWIAHLGDGHVLAVDTTTRQVVADVGDVAGVHGVVSVPQRRVVFATATGTNEIVAIDAATHQIVARGATGNFPDGVAYDADDNLVLVSNKTDGTVSVHDADTLAIVRTVEISGETGNVSYDASTGHGIVASLPPGSLSSFDPRTGEVLTTIELADCDGAHGVALDEKHQRVYVACEGNGRMVTVDLAAGSVVSSDPVGSGPDVMALDLDRSRLYIAAESGSVDVFDTSGAVPVLIGRQQVNDAAHSIAVDPMSGQLFLPLSNVDGSPVLRLMVVSPP